MDEELSKLIDTTRPHVPCMYDYYLGGRWNSKADRDAAQKVLDLAPIVRDMVRENRAFLGRSVRHLSELGVKQFIDIGCGLPTTSSNVHDSARAVQPDARVVYVDHDEVVKVLGGQILAGDDNSAVVIESCLNPQAILDHPETKRLIDFSKPVALVFCMVLHFMSDEQLPTILDPLLAAVPRGSYAVVSHYAPERDGGYSVGEEDGEKIRQQYKSAGSTPYARSPEQIEKQILLGRPGWEILEPGVVLLPAWMPEADVPEDAAKLNLFGGIAEKKS